MSDRCPRLLIAVTAILLVPGLVPAADQLIFGKKLLIKNPPSGLAGNKVVHLAKDATVTVGPAGGAGDPQCTGANDGGTSSVRIIASGGAGDVTIPLPCTGWTTNGSNNLYKYRAPSAAFTCSIVLVRAGALAKAVCKGPQVAIDLDGSMAPVTVVTTLNTQQYCTEFGGTVVKDGGDDKTFLRKDASPPGSCPTTSTTLPPETCCEFVGAGICGDVEVEGDASNCVAVGGTLASGVCDGATGTCQSSSGGESACCSGLFLSCVEGPGTPESQCTSLGGVFAQDSCADGCVPTTSTTSSVTSTTTTSTESTTSTSNTSSTSTTTSTTTSTSFPPCQTTGDPCGTVGAGCVCLLRCPNSDCGASTLECAKTVGGSCNTDPICFGFAGPSSFCVGNVCNPAGNTCTFNFASPGSCAIACP